MEMSLIHAGLAAGAALAALPVILHLFMRQTPKHVIFPALRLIRERQKQSKKRMRIKNWLLLLARMAILALMALALARPRLYSQVPLGDESVPTALGLVFDTSLSMEYKDKDKTRLDEAKERAREIIAKLPDSSLVFVVDSAEPGVPIGLPPSAALKRIDGLTIRPVNRPLNAAMGQVYAAVAECDRPVHVVYVLTDLARSAWNRRSAGRRARPGRQDQVGQRREDRHVRPARLTPQEIHNVAVDSAEPSVERGDPGRTGRDSRSDPGPGHRAGRRRLVEFELDGVKKGEKPSRFPRKGQVEVSFVTPPRLEEGELHRGKIKLSGDTRPLRERRRAVLHLQGSAAAQGPGHLRRRLRRRVRRRRARSRPGRVALPAVPGRNGSAPPSSAAAIKSDLQAVRLHLPAQRQQARRAGLGCAQPLRPRRGRARGRARTRAASRRTTTARSPSQFLPAQLEERPKTAKPETTFGKVANITHPLFQRYGKDLDSMLAQVPVYKLLAVKQPVEGDAHALELRRRCARPGGANVQGAQDRAGPALDDAALTPPRTSAATCAPIPTPGTSFPCRVRLVVPRS